MIEIYKDLDVIKIGGHKESWCTNYTLIFFFIVDLIGLSESSWKKQ